MAEPTEDQITPAMDATPETDEINTTLPDLTDIDLADLPRETNGVLLAALQRVRKQTLEVGGTVAGFNSSI